MHVNRSCASFVNSTFPTQIHLQKVPVMKKILIAVLSLAIGATAFAQGSGAPAPAGQTATASPDVAASAVAKK